MPGVRCECPMLMLDLFEGVSEWIGKMKDNDGKFGRKKKREEFANKNDS